MGEIRNAYNVKMDFTELSLEGADCINVRTPFLSNMATSDLLRTFRGSMVVSFSVVENFTEGNILQWNLQPL